MGFFKCDIMVWVILVEKSKRIRRLVFFGVLFAIGLIGFILTTKGIFPSLLNIEEKESQIVSMDCANLSCSRKVYKVNYNGNNYTFEKEINDYEALGQSTITTYLYGGKLYISEDSIYDGMGMRTWNIVLLIVGIVGVIGFITTLRSNRLGSQIILDVKKD